MGIEELPLLSSSLFSMNYFYLSACHIHYQGNLVRMWMILRSLNFRYGYEELKINLDLSILKNKFTSPLNLAGSVASLYPGSIILCVLYKLSNSVLVLYEDKDSENTTCSAVVVS